MSFLDLQDITLSFQENERLFSPIRKFNMSIKKGEFVCLLGRSGIGKTCILKAIGGFLPADKGKVLLEGKPVGTPSPEIMMVFQESHLYPWLTVEENIKFGLRLRQKDSVEIMGEVSPLLDITGLEMAAHKYPHELSGGMKQRTAIARALALNPRLLLLDEPFSALDVTIRAQLQDFIQDLWKKLQMTIVMVTHDIESAILTGSRCIVIGEGGSIMEDVKTTSDKLKDRYDPAFGKMVRRLEGALEL